MERYMGHIIRSTEKRVEQFLRLQVKDISQPDFGGMKTDMIEPKPTIYVLALAMSLYCNKNSQYYHNEELLSSMNLAMDFVGRCQRENGSLDYPSCNFNSAADTSFCFKRLMGAYRILVQYEGESQTEGIIKLKQKYLNVMKRSLHMIVTGGFHTPNHRWGITAALMQGASLFSEDKEFSKSLLDRAKRYLAEGIDGNEDGEYAERSTGNYNAVVNHAMMAMYEETGDLNYLGYVARNLNMMLNYIDPDDTIFTQNSTRQDQGKADYPDKYFYQYLYMAAITSDDMPYQRYHDLFDAAAHKIIRDNMERGDLAPECLHIIMAHKEMEGYQFHGYGYLDEYRKYFADAGVLRVRKQNYCYSILKGKSAFLFFKAGDTQVYVKIGESIGSVRNFTADSMEMSEGECVLKASVEASYYLPFEQPPATSDWWNMDHESREILTNSQLDTAVSVVEEEQGVLLKIHTEGLDGVPVRVQVCVPAGAVVEHDCVEFEARPGEAMILKQGCVRIRHHDRVILLGSGFKSHGFKGHYSGEERNDGGFTVMMNEYSPFDREIWVRVVN